MYDGMWLLKKVNLVRSNNGLGWFFMTTVGYWRYEVPILAIFLLPIHRPSLHRMHSLLVLLSHYVNSSAVINWLWQFYQNRHASSLCPTALKAPRDFWWSEGLGQVFHPIPTLLDMRDTHVIAEAGKGTFPKNLGLRNRYLRSVNTA